MKYSCALCIYESTNNFQFTCSPYIVEEQYAAWKTWQTQMAHRGPYRTVSQCCELPEPKTPGIQ